MGGRVAGAAPAGRHRGAASPRDPSATPRSRGRTSRGRRRAYPRAHHRPTSREASSWDAGALDSTLTRWPGSRRACGRPTTGASRPASSAGWSSPCASRHACRGRPPWPRASCSRGRPPASRGRTATTTGSHPISDGPTGCSACPMTSMRPRSPAASCAGGWCGARSAWRPGTAAGEALTGLYASIYALPPEAVEEAGRLRGQAAEVRDRGAEADPDGPAGAGRAYWPEVARLLRDSYRSLKSAVSDPRVDAR